jgi:hypothetical protein
MKRCMVARWQAATVIVERLDSGYGGARGRMSCSGGISISGIGRHCSGVRPPTILRLSRVVTRLSMT